MTDRIRENATILVFRFYILTLVSDFLYLIFFIVGNNIPSYQTDRMAHFTYNIEMLIILIIIQTLGGVLLFLSWYNKYYIFTKEGIIVKWGKFWKHEKRYNLKSVDEVYTDKSFFGNILQYGNVIIKDTFIAEPIKLSALSNPDNFLKIIEENYQKENDTLVFKKEINHTQTK